jgi:hypothetical protein
MFVQATHPRSEHGRLVYMISEFINSRQAPCAATILKKRGTGV